MKLHDTKLNISTLGRFRIIADGKHVGRNWPDETLQCLFCTLLSPLDMTFTWERLCRSIWDIPATPSVKERLQEQFIHSLSSYLENEFGFNPLVIGSEGISISRLRISLDCDQFYKAAVKGLNSFAKGNYSEVLEYLGIAESHCHGSFLPGMHGKIIINTRNALDSLFNIEVKGALRHVKRERSYAPLVCNEPHMRLMAF